jgi:predicted MFS family arabinose efflux permease
MLDGMHFSATQPPLRRLLIKMVLNFLMVSILLALIPSVVEQRMDGQPQTLGLLLACFGIGSVVGSLTLSRLYARFSRSRVIDVATFGHAIAVLIIGLSSQRSWSAAAMLLAGLSWTSMMTSVNIVAQMLLPARMRARGLSINMMAMMGSLALGAAIWGQVAEAFGLGNAFLYAAIGGLLMPILTSRMHLVEELPETLAAAPAAGPMSGEN